MNKDAKESSSSGSSSRSGEPSTSKGPLLKTVSSTELLGSGRQLEIRHRGETYTLRITANDKLILTK